MAEDEEGDLAAVLARAKLSKHADKCARYPCGMLPPVVVPCGLGRAVRCGLRFVWCSVGALLCKSCTKDTARPPHQGGGGGLRRLGGAHGGASCEAPPRARRCERLRSRPKFEPPPPAPRQLTDEDLEALGLKKPEIKRLRKVPLPRADCPCPCLRALRCLYWTVPSSYCMEGCEEGRMGA